MDAARAAPAQPAAPDTPHAPRVPHTLGTRDTLAWSAGSLGLQAMLSALAYLALFYLVTVWKLEPAIAGAAIFIGKLSDLLSYPALGMVADRLDTRWGRRKPLLLAGGVVGAGAFVLLYTTAAPAAESLRSALAVVAIVVYSLALATYNVPYMAMAADLCATPADRSRLMSWRSTFYMLGTFLGGPVATWLVGEFGPGARGFERMGWIVGSVLAASLLLPLLATPRAREAAVRVPSLRESLRTLFDNGPFNVLIVVKALQFLGFAGTQTTLLFFITLVLQKEPGYLAWYGGSIILAALPFVPVWRRVADRLGRKPGFLLALYVYAASIVSFLWATPEEPLWLFCLRAAVAGIGSGGMLVCGQAMLLDAMAHDAARAGRSREGLMSALYTFTEKLSTAVGPLLVALLLSWSGFAKDLPAGAPQPPGAYVAIEIGLVWLTVATTLAIHAALRRYRLEPSRGAG